MEESYGNWAGHPAPPTPPGGCSYFIAFPPAALRVGKGVGKRNQSHKQ